MNVVRWIANNAPEPVLVVLKPIYRRSRTLALQIADSLKIIGPSSIYDENYYAKRQEDPWRSDAQIVAIAIREYFNPESVIDFGCAIGAHLEPFYEEDIEIKGVEGNPAAFKYAVIPSKHLEQHDLREPYETEQSYDIALCFEVAEHIPEQFADVLVNTLVESSNTVIMTAATPGQGGTHHVNEQPREYWYKKFENEGMEYDSEAVEKIRSMIEVEETTWIPRNLMIFRSSSVMESL